VYFTPVSPPISGRVGADTATVQFTWSVVDSNTGQVKVANQLNQRGDEDYQVIDGIRFKVTGLYFRQLQSVDHINGNPAHSRALQPGLTWSGNDAWFFGGGAGYGYNFFQRVDGQINPSSSLIPPTAPFIPANPAAMSDSFSSAEIAFTDDWPIDQAAPPTGGQLAYRYYRKEVFGTGAAPAGGRGYTYGGFVAAPFTITDLETGNQLEAAFVERLATDAAGDSTGIPQPHSHEGLWLPDIAADSLGAFEYIFAIRSGYTGAPNPAFAVDGAINSGTMPVEYAIWPAYRDSGRVIDAGDAIDFTVAIPATANDTFRVDTTPLVRNDKALAKTNMNNIRAVPNPYKNHSKYELNQFNRVLRFTNLPESATIRIYSIAGDLVRTLQKTDPTSSTVDWDLQTTNRLPVGSGLYIFHVDSPGVGSYVGRVVVFMEKERLNNF
jgi:hypothetical protein